MKEPKLNIASLNTPNKSPVLLGIVGYSGTGKTTLLKALIPLLNQQGLNVGLIKHSHHNVDIDTPGKDSHTLRQCGASQTMVVCDQRWALMTETPNTAPNLYELALQFSQSDLILVEGFKQEPIPKIALYREALGKPLAELLDTHVLALATDTPQNMCINQPVLDLNQPQDIAIFIAQYVHNPS